MKFTAGSHCVLQIPGSKNDFGAKETLYGVTCAPTQKCWSPHPCASLNVTLFGDRAFADVTEWRWGLWVGPHPIWLEKRRRIDTQQEEYHVTTEGKIAVMQAKEHPELPVTPGAKEKAWNRFSSSLQREHVPANTLISDFWFPELLENTFLSC